MKVKTVTIEGVEYAVLQDGKPVVIYDDGREAGFDIPGSFERITNDGRENARLRKDIEEAKQVAKAFEGIDPEKARQAIETVANLDQKKLVDAGEIQRVKDEVAKGYEGKLADQVSKYEQLDQRYRSEKISAEFARSEYIGKNLVIPADIAEATFGRHFTVDDNGRVVAKDGSGNVITSKVNFGDPASFDEAFETIIAGYPRKDSILRSSDATGGGMKPSASGGQKTIGRDAFAKLAPMEQMAKVRDGFTITD